MNILLVAATPFEIRPTIEWLEGRRGVETLITGVGMTATTYSLTKALLRKSYDLVIGAGIAGSLDSRLDKGEVVIVSEESIGDLGVQEGGSFRSIFDLSLLQKNEDPFKDGRLVNDTAGLTELGLKLANGVTVNEITTDPARLELYRDQLHASVESMEGAPLHYVCLMEKIPFLQLRSISNFAGERDKSRWDIALAISNLNQSLQQVLIKYADQ